MTDITKKNEDSWEWVKAVVIALLLTFLIRQFIFSPVVVDGESMMPTLENKDRMIVNKASYFFGDPKRHDIIVFHAPGGKDYIKRVIGLPGDTIDYKDDTLYVNGEAVSEPYLDELKKKYGDTFATDDFHVEDIPEDQVFVLGDNRRHSRDSRDIGTVHIDEIVGKANIVFWPIRNIHSAK